MGRYVYQAFLFPEEEGYRVSFPDLPECAAEGVDFTEAAAAGAETAKAEIESLLKAGKQAPAASRTPCPHDAETVMVYFEADEPLREEEVISAADASRVLGVSPARITHMLKSGILDGFHEGRNTWVTKNSVEARKATPAKPGRPKKASS
ncbi:MAG: HicB family protein [Eggerthellaceae bacterium]|nr:HicB family protein [Eggerthellaceae bacterium]